MAANNFFGYHGQPPSYPPGAAASLAAAGFAAPPPGAVAVAAAAGGPPSATVVYSPVASVASTFRAVPQTVVAYSAYQPPVAVTGATYVAASGVTPITYPTAYPQYAQQQTAAAAAQIFDPTKAAASYYAAPNGVAVTVTYSAAPDPHYQARPVYSTNSNVTMVARPATAVISGPPRPSFTSYAQSAPTQTYTYGAPAVLSATGPKHIYVQNVSAGASLSLPVQTVGGAQQGVLKMQQWNRAPKQGQVGAAAAGAAAGQRVFKTRVAPKPQQLHYCEVCKISCAGPQTYKEHLEGQKHKKKEVAAKTGVPTPTTRGGNALRCELCDVTCTGSDAYAAHIRGAKHQKVVKLHTKLGKPIPCVDPVIVIKGEPIDLDCPSGVSPVQSIMQKQIMQQTYAAPKPPSVPKITFVGTSQVKAVEVAQADFAAGQVNAPGGSLVDEVTIPRLPEERDVQPVGHDYIEEIKNEEGKVVSFNCKLCECRFNDPNAKEMHMKGRRHRLQYKKKVNPDLVVDVKPSLRQRKLVEEKTKRTQAREDFWRRREVEFRHVEEEERAFWEERRRFEGEHVDFYETSGRGRFQGSRGGGGNYRFGPPPGAFMFGYHMMRRPDTIDDRHVAAKHCEIYPNDEELDEIQRVVSVTEKALKLVSDHMAEVDSAQVDPNAAVGSAVGNEPKETRILKGVMRVGVLAKGLVLKGDSNFRLVVLCGEKPTTELLDRIVMLLPEQLLVAAPNNKFTVEAKLEEGGLLVSQSNAENCAAISVDVSLTSPLVREESSGPHPENILDPEKCLEALAALRHAKWFQARAQGRQSCVMILRILREFCQRVPTWAPMQLFALELLVEKVLASAGMPLSPGDALRRVFEALAGGVLLSDSPGFLDPCEKEPQDAIRELSTQQREDITCSAQHALRLIAFRQIHKVLGMEALPPPKFGKGRFVRKRRRDDSLAGESGEGEQEEKKDKREEEARKAAAAAACCCCGCFPRISRAAELFFA